jgi:hypothetical protein
VEWGEGARGAGATEVADAARGGGDGCLRFGCGSG